ncbi:protein kinase C-binding protein 1 [Nephila pilipes]|uniref:Protein kinase C-binding protein 1 n=1 Tax=Nephila pilipes TaxID=299642 RepID=A0A8X6UF19_NEPPI|nr:protein kinase C-binding protein 1 [Nephila pilipes]
MIKKRLHWLLGRVLELFPGKDGIIRLVELRTEKGNVLRPIERLYPLELKLNYEQVVSENRKGPEVVTEYPELNTDSNKTVPQFLSCGSCKMRPTKRIYSAEKKNPKYLKKRSYPFVEEAEDTAEEEAKKQCVIRTIEDGREIDNYCWVCHKLGQDKSCNICLRAYHDDCLTRYSGKFTELNVCPECQLESLDGTVLSKFLTLEKLKPLLRAVTIRAFDKKREKKEILLRWPQTMELNEIAKIIDFEILLDNINKDVHYTKTTEFYSDIKCMYHNCCIAFGANSDQARVAEQLRKHFKKELLDLESCPECYYFLYTDEPDVNELDRFVRVCTPPHDIVWAQLTGHPFWPAKCLKVVKGMAHVRFFGEHEISDLPLNKCFHISVSHPKFKNSDITKPDSGPKSVRYKNANMELNKYIQLYKRVFGDFPFHPHRTHYKPKESIQEMNSDEIEVVAEDENQENQLSYGTIRRRQLKMEGNVQDEDSSTFEFSEGCEDTAMLGEIPENQPRNGFDSPVTSVSMTFSAESYSSNPILCSSDYTPESAIHETPSENARNFDGILLVDDLNSAVNTEAFASFNPQGAFSSGNPKSRLDPSISLIHNPGGVCSHIPTSSMNSEPSSAGTVESHAENSNASTEIISNPSESMEDDVVILDPPPENGRYAAQGELFNPSLVLPFILEPEPQLKSLFQHGQYILAAFFVRLWALLQKCPSAPERLSYSNALWKKYEGLYKAEVMEKEGFKAQCVALKEQVNSLNRDLENYNEREFNIHSKSHNADGHLTNLEGGHEDLVGNSKLIIEHLRNSLEMKDQMIETLKKESSQLKLENEELKKNSDNQKTEIEKLKEEIKSDRILSYIMNDYCRICRSPANIHCCLNHNYCSTFCKNSDYPKHAQICPNQKKKLSKPELASTSQLSMHCKRMKYKKQEGNEKIKISVEERKAQFIQTTETIEFIDAPSTFEETNKESTSSIADDTETDDDSMSLTSPASPTLESPPSNNVLTKSTRFYSSKRTRSSHCHQ